MEKTSKIGVGARNPSQHRAPQRQNIYRLRCRSRNMHFCGQRGIKRQPLSLSNLGVSLLTKGALYLSITQASAEAGVLLAAASAPLVLPFFAPSFPPPFGAVLGRLSQQVEWAAPFPCLLQVSSASASSPGSRQSL